MACEWAGAVAASIGGGLLRTRLLTAA